MSYWVVNLWRQLLGCDVMLFFTTLTLLECKHMDNHHQFFWPRILQLGDRGFKEVVCCFQPPFPCSLPLCGGGQRRIMQQWFTLLPFKAGYEVKQTCALLLAVQGGERKKWLTHSDSPPPTVWMSELGFAESFCDFVQMLALSSLPRFLGPMPWQLIWFTLSCGQALETFWIAPLT